MNVTDTQALLAGINFLLCAAIVWSCVVRAQAMGENDTALSWRLRYAALFGVSTLSAFSPLVLGEWPGVGQVLISFVLLLIVGFGGAWADGPPEYAKKQNASPTTQ